MADWRDVGIDNFKSAVFLIDNKKYRSAVSRFYCATFIILTYELRRRGAAGDFAQGRATPGHAQLPRLVGLWFTHFSEERRSNLARRVANLYRHRIASDYSEERIDRVAAKEALRLAEFVFDYLEIKR